MDIKLIFGSIELKEYTSLHAEKITRDENGAVVKREPYNPHIVCCGVEHCYICGRKLTESKRRNKMKHTNELYGPMVCGTMTLVIAIILSYAFILWDAYWPQGGW